MNAPEKALATALEPIVDEIVGLKKQLQEVAKQPGPVGERGADGKDGRDGKDADAEVVAKILVTDHIEVLRGEKGDPGKDGKDGKDGHDGKDADAELVAKVLATEYVEVLRGEKGDPGKDGKDGKDGRDGTDVRPDEVAAVLLKQDDFLSAVRGKDGDQGERGADGAPGTDGSVGDRGADGVGIERVEVGEKSFDLVLTNGEAVEVPLIPGEKGERGEIGESGRDGLGIETKQFAAGEVYRQGSFVTAHIGQFFKATRDTVAAPGCDDSWERVGTAGFCWKGLKPEQESLRQGDIYIDNGSLFCCMEDGQLGKMIVQRGQRGEKGDPGRDGKDVDSALLQSIGDELAIASAKAEQAYEEGSIIKADLEAHRKEVADIIDAMAQPDGAVGIRAYRGLFDPNSQYRAGDFVHLGNAVWLAVKSPSSGSLRADEWVKFAGIGTVRSGGSGGSQGGGLQNPIAGALGFVADGGATGRIELAPDPVLSGKTFKISSPEGIDIQAPYVVIDSHNPILTMPGAAVGAAVVVAGLDSAGRALLGYAPIPEAAYVESDIADADVVIKAANVAVPSAWVDLGLEVTINDVIEAKTAVASFVMRVRNATSRTGVLEFALSVDGAPPSTSETLAQSIPANFDGNLAVSAPIAAAFAVGQAVKLQARCFSASNVQFSASMIANSADPATFRIGGTTTGAAFVSQAARLTALELAVGDHSYMTIHGSVSQLLDDLFRRIAVLENATVPASEGALTVDKYGGSFLRVRWVAADHPTLPLLDGAEHYITLVLETTDEAGGEHFADTAALRAGNFGGTWFDNGGTLGKVTGSSGGDVSGNAIADYIDGSRTLKVKGDLTDPAHPKLIVLQVL